MSRIHSAPGAGPLDSFVIATGLETPPVDYAALKKNGFSIPQRDVRLQG